MSRRPFFIAQPESNPNGGRSLTPEQERLLETEQGRRDKVFSRKLGGTNPLGTGIIETSDGIDIDTAERKAEGTRPRGAVIDVEPLGVLAVGKDAA